MNDAQNFKFCTKCGAKISKEATFCEKCGSNTDNDKVINSKSEKKINLICPKCNSTNVSIQVVNESHLVTKHHGIIWWFFIGWWWICFKWLFLTVPALIFAIFVGKRKKIKNITKKKKVCQNCGYIW